MKDSPNKFIIVSQPRTGSNNISYILNAHPHLSVGNELLHPMNGINQEQVSKAITIPDVAEGPGLHHWSDNHDIEIFQSVLDYIHQDHDGFKIHTSHISLRRFEYLILERGYKPIFTVRQNKLEQVFSNYIAAESQVWHISDKRKFDTEMDPFEIEPAKFVSWLNMMYRDIKALENLVVSNDVDFHICHFELFFSGTTAQKIERVNRIFDFLEVPRIGSFETEVRNKVFSDLKKFMDSKKQRVTDKSKPSALIRNHEQLLSKYDKWMSKVFS